MNNKLDPKSYPEEALFKEEQVNMRQVADYNWLKVKKVKILNQMKHRKE